MKRYPYYPGCSIKGTGKSYEESLVAVFDALDVQLDELKDWNCCGATAYMSIDEVEAVALASRNLAIAEEARGDLVTPCNACYLVLNKTKRQLEANPGIRARIDRVLRATGLRYKGAVHVRHPLDILVNDIGLDALKKKVTAPLDGLKVAPYYGCQIVRPYADFDSQLNPVTMDRLLETAGAQLVEYPYKTRCCGGSQTGTIPEAGMHLVYMLLEEAQQQGAEIVATICPLCQFNLEIYQDRLVRKYGIDPIPVVYFTQILGIALGVPVDRLGLDHSVVPAVPVLTRRTADVA